MATELEIAEAKLKLDELLARAHDGEEIVFVEHGVPVAKLVPTDESAQDREHGFGMFKGQIWIADDFDAPLPEEELGEWEK